MMEMFKETIPKNVSFFTFLKEIRERFNPEVSWIFIHDSVTTNLEYKEGFVPKRGINDCRIFAKSDPYEEIVTLPLFNEWYALVAVMSNHSYVWENHKINDPQATILIKSE